MDGADRPIRTQCKLIRHCYFIVFDIRLVTTVSYGAFAYFMYLMGKGHVIIDVTASNLSLFLILSVILNL